MSLQIHNVEQGSEEWFALRLEHPLTASKAQAIGTGGKGLETLCWDKMAEKFSGAERVDYNNEHLDRGKELEEQARAIYELETGNTVVEVGFITDDSISQVGGVSPDGLVDKNGLFEAKCFADTKHFKMTKTGIVIESQYMWQMQMQMLFTGAEFCDFVLYNPNYKESLLVERVFPDKEKQDKILAGLLKGEELLKEINK